MKISKIFWGLFFLTAAALVVASQVVTFVHISVWSIIATVFLTAIFIHSVAELEFFGMFAPFAFLYMIYSGPLDWKYISPWILLSSAALVSIGFSILFHNRSKRAWVSKWKANQYIGTNHHSRTNESIDDNNPYAKVSLGSSCKYLHADCLQSGHFSSNLGELEVYFDQVQLSPGGAEIFVDCNLGAIKLYIPKHWSVIDHVNSILGDVSNKNRYNKPVENAPQLTLSGNVHLGSVEIQYI